MKGKDLKQWLLNKRKSFSDSRTTNLSRSATSDPDPPSMEIDLPSSTPAPPSPLPPPKTTFHVKGTPFRLHPRYSFHKALGLGAYGIVCSADDALTQTRVAVKKVAAVFEDLTDAKRIIREIRLMRSMRHENILRVLDIDEPDDYDSFNDVYIVTELMDTDMSKLLRSRHPLVNNQRKYFAYQICRAIKYIHSASILHRDLKPANILVSSTCDIKICDFGLARYMDPTEGDNQNMTEYVVTRWYRAPELLLAQDAYSTAIDMWSIGCLVAELYSRRPLFPGSDIKNQIECICTLLGKPSPDEINSIRNQKARAFLSKIPDMSPKRFSEFMPDSSPDAQDFVRKLLQFDPRNRLSAEEALAHPYLAEYRDPESEITGAEISRDVLEPPNEKKLGAAGIRRLMWDEILNYHPSARLREPPSARLAKKDIDTMKGY